MRSLLTTLLLSEAVSKYSDDQARDDHGRWSSGGGDPSQDVWGNRQLSGHAGISPRDMNVLGGIRENSIRIQVTDPLLGPSDQHLHNYNVIEYPKDRAREAEQAMNTARSIGMSVTRLPDSPNHDQMLANMATHGHYANKEDVGRYVTHPAFPQGPSSHDPRSPAWHELAPVVTPSISHDEIAQYASHKR